jgi:hypothetical protein
VHILDAIYINLDDVADVQVGFLAGRCEFAERNAAFGLQPDVDNRHVIFNGSNSPLDHLAFEAAVGSD